MLRVIAMSQASFIEVVIKLYAPEKKQSNHMADVYRMGNTIYLALKKSPSIELVTWIAGEFLPERLYFPFLGYSVDMIHEVGDVIVPNVFLGYSKSLENADINKVNRDNFVEKQTFIENFNEQKDYYVEDFGLSLGGILVSGAPEMPTLELHEKLMYAYEGDVYVSDDVFSALDVLGSDEVPTMILTGVVSGKEHSKYPQVEPIEFTIKNLLTTLDLLEADGEDM